MTVDHRIAERFVRQNWRALAASAWRFHLHYGPGALIVEWRVVERWSACRAFPFSPHYSTRTENAEFNAVIADYDPKTAVVIAFADHVSPQSHLPHFPGMAFAAMVITAQPSPPDAHRAAGH